MPANPVFNISWLFILAATAVHTTDCAAQAKWWTVVAKLAGFTKSCSSSEIA